MTTFPDNIVNGPGAKRYGKAEQTRWDNERTLVALLLNASAPADVRAALQDLDAGDLTREALREVVQEYRKLEANGTPVDIQALAARLTRWTPGELSDLQAEPSASLENPDAATVADRIAKVRRLRIVAERSRLTRELAEELREVERWEPIGQSGEAEARVAALEARLHDLDDDGTWEEAMPLPGGAATPTFPVSTLGSLAGDFVNAVAAETGTPVDMAAVALLGVSSTLIAGAVVVNRSEGWKQPVNLYTASLLQPGEGKTPVLRRVSSGPLDEIEAERQEQAAPTVREAAQQRRLLESRMAEAEKRSVKAKDSAARLEAEEEARNLLEELEALQVPSMPRLYTRDATPEALVKLLGEQNGRLAVIRDEGSEFFELAARYTTGPANLGVYLEGKDGGRYILDRVGREAIVVERVTLTVSLMAQHVLLESLAKDRQGQGRGLFARFLWVLPGSIVGSRETDRPVVPQQLQDAYTERLRHLGREADAVGEPIELGIEPEALRILKEWEKQHEPRLRKNAGDLGGEGVVEWANKLPGEVLRIAGNLHAIQTGTIRGTITAATMRDALALADYFSAHALAVFGQMRADAAERDAHAVLGLITQRRDTMVTVRDLSKSKHWEPDRVRAALTLLDRYGWLRKDEAPPMRRGRPSERYFVNPVILYP